MTKHRRHDRAKHNAMLKREWMKLYATEPHGERRAAEATADAFIEMSRPARELQAAADVAESGTGSRCDSGPAVSGKRPRTRAASTPIPQLALPLPDP